MAITCYTPKKFNAEHTRIIDQANEICEEYRVQGLTLTLRQIYYQYVSRGLLENKQSEYKRLGSILNDARMAGEMDWDHLIDRTRNLLDRKHWDSPRDMMEWSAKQFHNDLWKPQKRRLEVWVEKDAAIGVIEGVCHLNDIPYFACRGYTSVSELHDAAQRVRWNIEAGDQVTILHIGDHDPSGIDMTRDIEDRMRTFIHRDWSGLHMGFGQHTRGAIKASMRQHMNDKGNTKIEESGADPWNIKRIALNHDQILQYNPPPNPAKQTDSRFEAYMEQTGLDESWELDALDPVVLQTLISDEIDLVRDEDLWDDTNEVMEKNRQLLTKAGKHWNAVKDVLEEKEAS